MLYYIEHIHHSSNPVNPIKYLLPILSCPTPFSESGNYSLLPTFLKIKLLASWCMWGMQSFSFYAWFISLNTMSTSSTLLLHMKQFPLLFILSLAIHPLMDTWADSRSCPQEHCCKHVTVDAHRLLDHGAALFLSLVCFVGFDIAISEESLCCFP